MNFFTKNRFKRKTGNFISFVIHKKTMMRTLLVISLLVVSQLANAEKLKAFFSYKSFYSPVSGPYIETYMSVIGNSVEYTQNENGKFQGKIEVTLVFKDGEEIINFKKYNLLSPEVEDTSSSFMNFVDQQRFSLPNSIPTDRVKFRYRFNYHIGYRVCRVIYKIGNGIYNNKKWI